MTKLQGQKSDQLLPGAMNQRTGYRLDHKGTHENTLWWSVLLKWLLSITYVNIHPNFEFCLYKFHFNKLNFGKKKKKKVTFNIILFKNIFIYMSRNIEMDLHDSPNICYLWGNYLWFFIFLFRFSCLISFCMQVGIIFKNKNAILKN